MIKIYLDRNVDVKNLKNEINYREFQEKIEFMQWPLEGRTKRIKDYGLPAGEITWNDLSHITWDELDFCTWDDFDPTPDYNKILTIVGKQHRFDCIHFDIAIKNKCSFYLTSDKDFLDKRVDLENLSGIQIFDPANPSNLQLFRQALETRFSLASSQAASPSFDTPTSIIKLNLTSDSTP